MGSFSENSLLLGWQKKGDSSSSSSGEGAPCPLQGLLSPTSPWLHRPSHSGSSVLQPLLGGLQCSSFGYPQNEAGRGFLSECGGPTPTVGWAPPGSCSQADPQLAGICCLDQPGKQEQLLGFPCTSMRALPRLPQPPASRGHCWDRMGASPTLEILILLWSDGAASFGGHSLCWGGELCVGARPAWRTCLKSPDYRSVFQASPASPFNPDISLSSPAGPKC